MEKKNNCGVRLASFDDLRSLNSLVSSCGGVPLMKAMFGPFNFPLLMENSVISVVSTQSIHSNETIVGFLSASDILSVNIDVTFEELVNEISQNTKNANIKVKLN
jgi:hypothetical protein